MNRIYQSIWNDKSGTFVAASENARNGGKQSSPGATAVAGGGVRFALKGLAVSLMLAFGSNVYAAPVGGTVSAGSASISGGAGRTTINQSSQNVAINWQSFSIGQGEAVQFVQPNSSSVALNRVLGADASSILGSLSANGKVFLLNPNGILFGQGAQVNVGGLVASTLNITDGDFMAGKYNFAGAGKGTILNQGSINADGGYVALLGANISNEGLISARLGTVVLAAGNAVTLDVAGDGLLNVTINQGVANALVQNGGLIRADGGQVLLTAQAAGTLLQGAVNNTGVIQAQTVENHNGTIRLLGDMQSGTTNVAGKLDASAPNGGDGGFIETSAAHVKVADSAIVTAQSAQGNTGTWLIDPTDFTIASSGGDITPAALAVNLATNVTISSNDGGSGTLGDINVNNDVTWGAATTLTLNAVRNVNLNANITATTGSLVLTAGTDVIANAMAGTGITTTGGNDTWTAGNDIWVKAGVVGGITATSGNILWTAGHDVKIDSAVTATSGNFTVCCGRDINVNAAVTTTDGGVSLKAGRDLVIAAAMTTTRGNVVLSAGSDGSGLGVAGVGGTVVFGTGILYTVTAPGTAITLDYTPTSYATPHDYSGNFTGTASSALTQHMLVFAKGNDKVYDGNTTATLSFAGNPSLGGVVTLVPGTATFDDKNVAPNIGITYSGYSLGGADAGKFALWTACTDVAGSGRTSAAITPRPMTLQANDNTKVYGQTFTPLGTAFTIPVPPIAGETVTSVAETSTGSVATASVAGSTYPILITPGSATGSFTPSNYTIIYLPGALTVTPAPLTVTANNATKVYGQTFTPAGTAFTTSALQNGEVVGSVTEASPAGTPPTAPVPGPYAITPSAATGGTFAPSNYTITYVDGALTVTPAPLTLQANDATKVYGQTFTPAGTAFTVPVAPQNGETVTAVTETSTGSAPTASVAGSTYPIVITPGSATGSITPTNYIITYLPGALSVTPAPLTVTANDATKPGGTTLAFAGTEFTNTATQNGETVSSVTLVSAGTPASATAATYPITPSAATGSITPSNYTIDYVNGALTVTPVPLPLVSPVPPGVTPPVTSSVSSAVPGVNLAVLGTGVKMPPAPPPPVVVVPPEAPPVVEAPPEAPPPVYVPPVRPRKPDRN